MKLDNGTFLSDPSLWTRGGIDTEANCFTIGNCNMWRLVTPLPVPSMTKILFTVPEGFTVRFAYCVKKGNACTGDINADYSFEADHTKWRTKNYEFYAGNEDTLAMFVIAFEDGRPCNFEDLPVRFYSPRRGEIPSYWENSLSVAEEKIRSIRKMLDNPVEFFYLTDVHWTDNAQRSPAILNHLSKQLDIPYVVFGGDMIVRYNADKNCARREIREFFDWLDDGIKVFTTLGNHDRNYSSGNTNRALRFSEEETHKLYMNDIESFAVTEGDPSHGYFDFPAQKVRMVQFYLSDSMFGMPEDSYVDGALDWVEQKILELDRDWTVVLFTHAYSRGNGKDGSTIVTPKNEQIRDRLLSIKERARAELALWITGHIHVDGEEVLTNGNTSLCLVTVLSDGYKYASSPRAAKMRVCTDTEQAIDCFQLDLKNRTFHVTRIGAGTDRIYKY